MPPEDPERDGWLLSVYELDRGGFEACFIDDPDHSGWVCGARAGELYYTVLFPTDAHFPPEQEALCHETQSALIDWVWETVLAREGVEPFDCKAYLSQPYLRAGCQYVDVLYWPYKAVNGSTDVVWTLRMVQPVTQGDGGIWGVERVDYGGGESQPIRPQVQSPLSSVREKLSADEYYRRLQDRGNGQHRGVRRGRRPGGGHGIWPLRLPVPHGSGLALLRRGNGMVNESPACRVYGTPGIRIRNL